MSSETPVIGPIIEGGEEEGNGASIIYGLLTAFFFALLIQTVSGFIPSRLAIFRFPFSGLMMIAGIFVGLLAAAAGAVKYTTEGVAQLEQISPEVIFAVFLPALFFPSGLDMDWHIASKTWWHFLLLAVPGTLINASLIAVCAYYVLPYSWTWAQSSLVGAILSATDPVAVLALMRSLNTAPRLSTMIDGEALLNDGVAYAIFAVCRDWAAGEDMKAGEIIGFTFKAALGGPAMGLLFGVAAMIWLACLYNQPMAEISVTLVTVYSLWLLCDEVLGVSGILALFFCSLFMGAYGKYWISRSSAEDLHFFWMYVEWAANVVIFFLCGLIFAAEAWTMSSEDHTISASDWGYGVLFWILLIAIRTFSVVVCYPLLRLGSYGVNFKDAIILSWAGLRGAVGLTLSLSIFKGAEVDDASFKVHQFFLVGLMAVLSLLVQGTTCGPLLKFLGYMNLPPLKKDAMLQTAAAIDRFGDLELEHAKSDLSILGDPDWAKVEKLTKIRVLKEVKKKPVSKSFIWKGVMPGVRMTPSFVGKQTEPEVLDLRERVLSAVKAVYAEIFAAEHLRGSDQFLLQDVTEMAMDAVDEGLKDWEVLQTKLTPVDKMQLDIGSKLNVFKKAAYYRKLLKLRRDTVLVSTFIYAHAVARKRVLQFAHLKRQALDVESGEVEPSGGTPLKPYWKSKSFAGAGASSNEEQVPSSLTTALSKLRGVAISDPTPGDHLDRKRLMSVLDESRDVQERAEKHLELLKKACPNAVEQVRTMQVVTSLLKEEQELILECREAGVLDEKEVDDLLNQIEQKMKLISALVAME